jgi:quinol monooxygenase YgiN
MAFVLVVRMTARAGEEERAAGLIRELTRASSAESGCNLYVPHRDPEDPRVFLVYEQYRDRAAFEEHGQTEHFQSIAAGQLFGLMESRERSFYETLA